MKKVEIYRDKGPVDEKEIDKFEASVGYKFPAEYKNLLKEHNALYPSHADFDFINASSGDLDGRDVTFLGFGDSLSKTSQIQNSQNQDVYGHDGLVIFGRSGNGDYICFSYQHDMKTDAPKVVVMLHDFPDEDGKMLVNFVANSFEEFMDSLYSENDED